MKCRENFIFPSKKQSGAPRYLRIKISLNAQHADQVLQLKIGIEKENLDRPSTMFIIIVQDRKTTTVQNHMFQKINWLRSS